MKLLFVVTCLSVIMSWAASAIGQTIGKVDMRQIFQASPQIKAINIQLEKEFLPQRERIINLDKYLREDVKKLKRNEVVMSKKETEDLRNRIQEEQKEFQQSQVEFQQRLYKAQNQAIGKFIIKISGAVKTVAKKEKIDLVLPKDTLLYARDSRDITLDVISELNSL
ncbi:OmpH family outer membrane protein [Coxiella endosymbiont of Dermacentor marginatus]|uniref:OmpH family outer membrane protein n=1 Tax=Coxiella endosymbiont of Dermacentor marginatus TaxID=1656159 RepID=UPI002221EE74|nr:OmpH family outer membrane protein [Coxiella endosymbiont of Dermacentor marginatus]